MLQRRSLILLFCTVALLAWFETDVLQWLGRVSREVMMSRESTTSPVVQNNELKDHFAKRHQEIIRYTEYEPVELLFIGDSITEAFPGPLWDKFFDQYNAANFGVSSDRTQQVLWRIENGELDRVKPRVIVLQIGTNNIARNDCASIARGTAKIIQEIQAKLPDARIVLMGIFPREHGGEGARQDVITTNRLYARLAEGEHVRFLDIGEKFLDQTGHVPVSFMPDGLHLSEAGYEIWGAEITPVLQEMLGNR